MSSILNSWNLKHLWNVQEKLLNKQPAILFCCCEESRVRKFWRSSSAEVMVFIKVWVRLPQENMWSEKREQDRISEIHACEGEGWGQKRWAAGKMEGNQGKYCILVVPSCGSMSFSLRINFPSPVFSLLCPWLFWASNFQLHSICDWGYQVVWWFKLWFI